MNQIHRMKTATLLALTGLILTACGGGGGGSSAPSNTTPPTSPGNTNNALPPQTSVPATTYPAGSANAQLVAAINAYRGSLGVGLMRQDSTLDVAAQAHANYEQTNLANGAITVLGHDESPTLTGFTGTWPLQRARSAGVPAAEFVGEVVAATYETSTGTTGTDCANQWLDTVYHLQGVTGNSESVGVGIASSVPTPTTPGTSNVCALEVGTSTALSVNPDPNNPADVNTVPDFGGQQFATNLIVHAPYSGETGVPLAMVAETPNPAPDVASPGRPVMVRVNQSAGNKLTVATFQLVDGTGAAVSARILVAPGSVAGSTASVTADPNNTLGSGIAFLLPLAPLKANTTYTVTFSGARDGTPMSTTWSFTTAAQ